jgi:uncharacterized membrane protein
MAGAAYTILQKTLVARHGSDSLLARAVGNDVKGKVSLALYAIAIAAAFVRPVVAIALYVVVAVMWLVPDRRIEAALVD